MPILRDSMQAKFANIRRRTSGLRRSHTWTAADVRSDFQPDSRARPGAHRPGMGTVPEKGLTFFSLVRSGSVNSVKHLVKLFELKMMSEGRKTQIVLLDERRLEILIQPKLYAGELLDLVASHFNLKEKEYFGLSFKDDTSETKGNKDRKQSFQSDKNDSGHHHWLQLDRKVLEHDFPKKSGPLTLYFSVRFFIESIAYLRDNATIELFYLQAKQSIFKDIIECDSDTAFELAAHVLQATYGDYTEDDITKGQLKKLPVLPTSALKEHPSIAYCEEEVINYYKKLAGQSRGSAIVNYMTIAESLPTYGIHYYEVKDKSGIPWWLGLSYKGIAQYDHNDKKTPRRVFAWKQLENLYFRDKKFSIEVHDPKRIVHTLSSFNLYEDAIQEPIEDFDELSDAISDPTTQVSVSRRTFGPGNVNVHAWFAATPALTKCIWSMAVSQHQFYLDRKQSKSQLPSVRSMSEIAADLCQSTSSLPSSASGSISRSNSAHSLTMSLSTNNTKLDFSPEELEANRAAQRDMYAALKARKDALEDALRKKTEELKALCLQESELTGELPPEFPLVAGDIVPQVRRRVGTAFTLSPNIMNRDKSSQVGQSMEEELLAKLEVEFEIQDKITKAAARLAHDMTGGKSVRKQRQHTYRKAYQKLKDLERRLNEARRNCGRTPVQFQSSVEDMSEDSLGTVDSEPEFISPANSPAVQRSAAMREQYPQVEVVELEHPGSPSLGRPLTPSSQGSSIPRSGSPVSPSRQGAPGVSRGSTPSPNPPRYMNVVDAQYPYCSRQYTGGYTPNSVYQTRTQYRVQNYPTFTTRSQSSSSTQSEYDNVNGLPGSNRHMTPPHQHRFDHNPQETMHNMYNVSTNQTVHYNSADELGKALSSDDLLNDIEGNEHLSRIRLPSKHGSLEGAYRRRSQSGDVSHIHRYASQEQNLGHQHFIMPHLVPSRFGSKRESTADYRDSMYPPDDYTVYNMADVDEMSHSGSSVRDDYSNDFPPPPPPHEMNHLDDYGQLDDSVRDQSVQEDGNSNGLPYMDSTMPPHSVLSPTGGQWYPNDLPGSVRQQPAPHTPQTEGPPQPYAQDAYDSDAMSPSVETPPHLMTVTKYQSYVEVSKPFEMSDFYKYSEKLRRQRNIQSRQQKLEAVLSGQPLPKSASQESNISSNGPPPVPVRYNSYISSPNAGSPGALSPVSSAYGSPARPSSPYTSSSQGSQRSSRPSSPYGAPPSPGNYPSVRTRGPYAVQSNLVQTHYHAQSVAYHQGIPQQVGAVPQHTSYHPPKAMACEPLRSPATANTSNKNTPQNRYHHYGNHPSNHSHYDHSLDQSSFYSDQNSGNGSYYGDQTSANNSYYGDQHYGNNSYYSDQSPRHYDGHTPGSGGNNNNQSLSLSFDPVRSVGNAFSQEMLAWFDEQDQCKPSTLV